jgi:hypothetical protein
MTANLLKRTGRPMRRAPKEDAKKSFDDRNLIDSSTEKAERDGARFARKILASLEKELGLVST